MQKIFLHQVTLIWLLLIFLTVTSWLLGEQTGGTQAVDAGLLSVSMLLIGFVKVRFVGLHFMEMQHAPLPLRMVFEAWVVVVCLVVLFFYWRSVGGV